MPAYRSDTRVCSAPLHPSLCTSSSPRRPLPLSPPPHCHILHHTESWLCMSPRAHANTGVCARVWQKGREGRKKRPTLPSPHPTPYILRPGRPSTPTLAILTPIPSSTAATGHLDIAELGRRNESSKARMAHEIPVGVMIQQNLHTIGPPIHACQDQGRFTAKVGRVDQLRGGFRV